MKTDQLLNAVKAKLELRRDADLARTLETSTARIAQWRKGQRAPDEQACFQIADILGVDPAAVIALVKAERETEPAKAAFWRMQAGKYAAALGVLTMLNSGSVAAAIGHGYTAAVKITAVCIMRNREWWRGMRQNLKYSALELQQWLIALFQNHGQVGHFGNRF